jgi:hypothetical protein
MTQFWVPISMRKLLQQHLRSPSCVRLHEIRQVYLVAHTCVNRLLDIQKETNLSFVQGSIRCELEIRKWNQILILLPNKGRLKFHVHNKSAVNRARNVSKSRQFVSCVLKIKIILHNKRSVLWPVKPCLKVVFACSTLPLTQTHLTSKVVTISLPSSNSVSISFCHSHKLSRFYIDHYIIIASS